VVYRTMTIIIGKNILYIALPFVPVLFESFGRLGAPALMLLGDLADQLVQAGGPGITWAALISALPFPGQRVPVSAGRVRHDAGLRPDPDARSCLALGRGG
jgi:hypothetical protein